MRGSRNPRQPTSSPSTTTVVMAATMINVGSDDRIVENSCIKSSPDATA